jgi:hypothetical protein
MKKFLVVLVLLFFASTEAFGCVDPWGNQVINNYTTNKPTAISGSYSKAVGISGGQFGVNAPITATGGQGGAGGKASAKTGPVTQSVVVNAGSGGSGSGEYKVMSQLLQVQAYQAAPPMDYRGDFEPTAERDVQPWFDKPNEGKFKEDFFTSKYPNSGIVSIGAITDKSEPTKFFYVKDVRKKLKEETQEEFIARLETEQQVGVMVPPRGMRENRSPDAKSAWEPMTKPIIDAQGRYSGFEPVEETEVAYIKRLLNHRKGIKIANGICKSGEAKDDAITVWGACARGIFPAGIEYVYITDATLTPWVEWQTDNKGASLGIGVLWGWIWGLTGQGGVNYAKGTSGPAWKVTVVFQGYRVPKQ